MSKRGVRLLLFTIGLAVLLGASIAAAPPGDPDQSPTVEPVNPAVRPESAIRVLSSEHEVHFPSRMDFTLTAESESPITSITFYYRLAGRPVSVYGYPTFEPGTLVTARFSIDSGRSAYIPPGVEVEYHYVIENEAGERLESEPLSLLYMDPSFDWRTATFDNIEVLWHDRPRDTVERAARLVDARLTEVRRVFGLTEKDARVMRAVILNDRQEANRTFPPISSAATDSHLYAGFAYGEFDLFVLVGLGVEGMVHEMTHLLLDEAIVSRLARVPAWFNEGLAMYFESEPDPTNLADPMIVSAARSGSLLPLTAMRGQPGRPADVRLFYAQARSLVRYMADVYGEEGITRVVASLSGGTRFEDAVADAYGRPLEEIDADWRRSVGAAVSVSQDVADGSTDGETGDDRADRPGGVQVNHGFERSFRADPGTLGTSILMAAAFAFALSVVAGGWLLRRRATVFPPDGAEPDGFDERYFFPP